MNYESYYAYLMSLIEIPVDRYSKLRQRGLLLYELWKREFSWLDIYDSEEDRASDGKTLRDRFLIEFDETPDKIPQGPCRVLEALIAFAIKIDSIIFDWRVGHRPYEILEMFILNLGFDELTDTDIQPIKDAGYIDARIDTWLAHKIGRSGEGGLFRFRRPVYTIDNLTNWDQMNKWVLENFQ